MVTLISVCCDSAVLCSTTLAPAPAPARHPGHRTAHEVPGHGGCVATQTPCLLKTMQQEYETRTHDTLHDEQSVVVMLMFDECCRVTL